MCWQAHKEGCYIVGFLFIPLQYVSFSFSRSKIYCLNWSALYAQYKIKLLTLLTCPYGVFFLYATWYEWNKQEKPWLSISSLELQHTNDSLTNLDSDSQGLIRNFSKDPIPSTFGVGLWWKEGYQRRSQVWLRIGIFKSSVFCIVISTIYSSCSATHTTGLHHVHMCFTQ